MKSWIKTTLACLATLYVTNYALNFEESARLHREILNNKATVAYNSRIEEVNRELITQTFISMDMEEFMEHNDIENYDDAKSNAGSEHVRTMNKFNVVIYNIADSIKTQADQKIRQCEDQKQSLNEQLENDPELDSLKQKYKEAELKTFIPFY